MKGHGTEYTTKEYEKISEGKVVEWNILPKNYEDVSDGKVVGRNILPKNMKRSQKERSWDGTYKEEYEKIPEGKVVGRNILLKNYEEISDG
jgi:hypothetical protein